MVKRRPASEAHIGQAFLDESRRRLDSEYLPKIRSAVAGLATTDLWWRPNARSNSIGNLLVHLEGNVRQWILGGIARRPTRRDREAEFAIREGRTARSLVAHLAKTLREVDGVLAALRPEELADWREIQGYRVTVLQAVYHVVEHFSGHTGQILFAVKLRRDRDLNFYEHLRPTPRTRRAAPSGALRRTARPTPAPRRRRFM